MIVSVSHFGMTARVPVVVLVRLGVPAPSLLVADTCEATDDECEPSGVVKAVDNVSDELVSVSEIELVFCGVADRSRVLDNMLKGLVLVGRVDKVSNGLLMIAALANVNGID